MPDGYKRVRYYECNVHKVFLSSNPTTRPHDYVVVAIYGMLECLAFIKAGQEFWTYVNVDYNGFTDISFYKGLVYAVGRWNNIVSFDFSNSKNSFDHEKVIPNVLQTRGDNYYAHRGYLVESLEGDLLLVRKWIGFPDDDNEDEERNLPSSGTKGFEVYKLELDLQSEDDYFAQTLGRLWSLLVLRFVFDYGGGGVELQIAYLRLCIGWDVLSA
ncbi:cyclin F-box [Trifolium pratense]|uniref:Cyclin F-box n=1 Tax=Trifolium pratense TaxID=57577 RepID=A0A2K3N3W7_TRIPR|nr:cyclin F-box [Trifolium pratense]